MIRHYYYFLNLSCVIGCDMLNKYELGQHVVNLRFADVFNFFTINTTYFDDEPNSETSPQHTIYKF